MEENNQKPIGELFGNISYHSPEQLNLLIDNLDEEQAVIMIKFACEKALYSGIFTLSETEILLKSLRKFHSNQ
jgi:hypothetical protein